MKTLQETRERLARLIDRLVMWLTHKECSEVKEPEAFPYRYRVFCCGETGLDSVAGDFETMIPLEPGHIHVIKGRRWYCDWVDKNADGDQLANFRLAT